ncbi:alpha/beta fold hydrolase [Streptomyces hesseae]|uniref:Alpha/beta fold hydrolase n=1 Tax=Streptomyces hesseae TaxID=3075519 RepID=A0ABU2SP42_9ACTN|nr:alpha/beta fold hydrolase [Streptomyces sp. DSM 40473]MDT0450744.1 alpha/beta fold hydrolase [Streptomyces sp. DSM 40473]
MTDTDKAIPGTLEVPGATLHYEVRGSGPLLLLIPGGAGDAGMYAGMAAPLTAAGYAVASFDPRALSRSRLHGPLGDQRVAEWSEDARLLIDHLSPDEPAAVMGCSSGAIVALDLLARHPDRVRRLIAHEPPLLELLEDPAPQRALFADVREAFRAEGVGAAMARFAEGVGEQRSEGASSDDRAATELPPEIQEMAPRMHANLPVFLDHMLVPFSSTTPDVTALRSAAAKLVPAAGRLSRDQVPLYGPVARLAALVGRPLEEFPGGHLGAVERPGEFAERVVGVLGGA